MKCDNSSDLAILPPPEILLGPAVGSSAVAYCRSWDGRMLAANQTFARKFGCNASELPGRAVADFLHAEDVRQLTSADRELKEAPHRALRDSRWLTPQGLRWISWEESAVFDSQGNAIGARAVGHDITRQRVAEEQFYKLSRAVEQSPIAMVITDSEGQVQYVNPKFTEATGNTLEQILDSNIAVLREGHPDEVSYKKFWDTVQSGREWRGELKRERPGGKRVWESVQVSCLRNAAGEVTNLLCLREDITDRKMLEEELRQVQKMDSLGTLAGGIAHDFNNLIAIISGYAELASFKHNDSVAVQKSLQEIRRAADRATGLVRQILTFSRKAEIQFTSVDLNQLCRDLVVLLRATFPRNVVFDLALDDNLPPLHADQNQLQQIVLNLCVNARDAMPTGGTITLSTSCVEREGIPPDLKSGRRYACLSASDTGTGMTAEVRARIFEPFYTTKGADRGTGLGLSVVYGVAASHEGSIQVDSEPGLGSTFRVYLPLAENVVPVASTTRTPDFLGGSESILVIDEGTPSRLQLENSLNRKGYRASGASGAMEAIDRLVDPSHPFDAIILDFSPPGANGIELLRVMKAAQPKLKALILAGELSPIACKELEELGQNHFVSKPYKIEQLGRKLRELLDERKSGS